MGLFYEAEQHQLQMHLMSLFTSHENSLCIKMNKIADHTYVLISLFTASDSSLLLMSFSFCFDA